MLIFYLSHHPCRVTMPEMQLTVLRSEPVYATAILTSNTLVVGVLPITVLAILNCKIIKTMRRNTKVHNIICNKER